MVGDQDVGITGNFEITTTARSPSGSVETILMHSKRKNERSKTGRQRFCKTKDEQTALIEKIDKILMDKDTP